jgi:hypothetical protein
MCLGVAQVPGRSVGASLATDPSLIWMRPGISQTALDIPRLRRTQAPRSGPFVDLALSQNTNLLAPPLAPQPVRIFSNLASDLEPPYGIEP